MGKEDDFVRVSRSSLLNATLASWGLFFSCFSATPAHIRCGDHQNVSPLCFSETHSLTSSLLPSPLCKISAVQVRWELAGLFKPL